MALNAMEQFRIGSDNLSLNIVDGFDRFRHVTAIHPFAVTLAQPALRVFLHQH